MVDQYDPYGLRVVSSVCIDGPANIVMFAAVPEAKLASTDSMFKVARLLAEINQLGLKAENVTALMTYVAVEAAKAVPKQTKVAAKTAVGNDPSGIFGIPPKKP